MPCYHPMRGYKSLRKTPNGKHTIVFNPKQGYIDMPMVIPCGQCIGCRLERSRQWAIRCVHEASLHQNNCFITLTFDDKHLSSDGSLHLEDFQRFMKRLRKKFGPGVRYFHCGEYGEKFLRPHHHACLFNFDFADKKHYKTIRGNTLFTSKTLEELWPFGFSTIGAVTFESAAYVARYITKKITGKNAEDHYSVISETTGEILSSRKPEYTTMSRRPGIGKGWFEKFKSDVYPDDFCLLPRNGNLTKIKPPKYYDKLFEISYPSDYRDIKRKRKNNAETHTENNTPERLTVREYIQKAKFKLLKRSYENET